MMFLAAFRLFKHNSALSAVKKTSVTLTDR